MENSTEGPQKLKIQVPYDPSIPLLGMYPKKPKTLIQKDACTPMFIAAFFTIAKIRKQPKYPSTNKWINKKWYIYIYICIHIYIYIMEYYSIIKNNEILPFATTWMDLENIILSEISQTEKSKYCMLSLVHGI